jgi:hypothetical protein
MLSRPGQGVEQGRLAGIGIADQGHMDSWDIFAHLSAPSFACGGAGLQV